MPPRAQNLRQGIVMKTSFKTQVLRMGLSSLVDINIFVLKYFLFSFFRFFFFSNLLNQYLLNVKPQKGNSRALFNDERFYRETEISLFKSTYFT